MKVLIACEFSGIVRNAFLNKGHDAISIDLLPSETKGPHIQMDITHLNEWNYDLMIAHPPCTYLCNSGVRWLYEQPDRWTKLEKAINFFNFLMTKPIKKIAIENPIPHKYAKEKIGNYTQLIQPWLFGHGETKAICLWLKNLPLLTPTNIVNGRKPRVHYEAPSKDRWKNRSRFYTGIASAMVKQWSDC